MRYTCKSHINIVEMVLVGRLKELALENRPILGYKCKWHYLELDMKTQQPSQELLVSWANLWWQRLMILFLFLNILHHKRYQEQDAENILHCLILPLYPGRVGACIKSTFHSLLCVCALSGSCLAVSHGEFLFHLLPCRMYRRSMVPFPNRKCFIAFFVYSFPAHPTPIASFGTLLQLLLCFIISHQVESSRLLKVTSEQHYFCMHFGLNIVCEISWTMFWLTLQLFK